MNEKILDGKSFLSVFNDTTLFITFIIDIIIVYSKKEKEKKKEASLHNFSIRIFSTLINSNGNNELLNYSSLVIVLYNLWNILWHRVKVIVHLTPLDRQLNRYIRIYCLFN